VLSLAHSEYSENAWDQWFLNFFRSQIAWESDDDSHESSSPGELPGKEREKRMDLYEDSSLPRLMLLTWTCHHGITEFSFLPETHSNTAPGQDETEPTDIPGSFLSSWAQAGGWGSTVPARSFPGRVAPPIPGRSREEPRVLLDITAPKNLLTLITAQFFPSNTVNLLLLFSNLM
jgi:hypothetical protein